MRTRTAIAATAAAILSIATAIGISVREGDCPEQDPGLIELQEKRDAGETINEKVFAELLNAKRVCP